MFTSQTSRLSCGLNGEDLSPTWSNTGSRWTEVSGTRTDDTRWRTRNRPELVLVLRKQTTPGSDPSPPLVAGGRRWCRTLSEDDTRTPTRSDCRCLLPYRDLSPESYSVLSGSQIRNETVVERHTETRSVTGRDP